MMPDIDREERRKKRVPVIAFILFGTLVILVVVSRLMPRPAGRRWLAEAESLLAEIAPGLRAAALRSYLLSAAGLAVKMWVREAQRRARPGTRRPG